jgi:hypothetical protein
LSMYRSSLVRGTLRASRNPGVAAALAAANLARVPGLARRSRGGVVRSIVVALEALDEGNTRGAGGGTSWITRRTAGTAGNGSSYIILRYCFGPMKRNSPGELWKVGHDRRGCEGLRPVKRGQLWKKNGRSVTALTVYSLREVPAGGMSAKQERK